MIVGCDYRLPASMLMGASFLIVDDGAPRGQLEMMPIGI